MAVPPLALDSSGNLHHLTYFRNGTSSTNLVHGVADPWGSNRAVGLSETSLDNQHTCIAYTPSQVTTFDTTVFTVAAWVYSHPLNNPVATMISLNLALGTGVERWAIGMPSSPSVSHLTFFIGSSGTPTWTSSNFTSGTWTHIAVTFDGAQCIIYFNGSAVQTSAATIPTANTNNALTIGANQVTLSDLSNVGPSFASSFIGRMAGFGYWNGVLPASAILSLYSAGTHDDYKTIALATNPLALWMLDEAGTPGTTSGFYPGTITMGTSIDSITSAAGWALSPFYNSPYGIAFHGNLNSASQANGLYPRSAIYLYQIITDSSSASGYSVYVYPSSLLEGWGQYELTSGAYFLVNHPALALNDSTIIIRWANRLNLPTQNGFQVLTRNADNTLSLTGPYDLVTQTLSGFQVTNGRFVRYDDTRFARGDSVTNTSTHRVWGYQLASGVPSIISTTTAVTGYARFENIDGYDADHGCLIGDDPNTSTINAYPWTPELGATGSAISKSHTFPNFGIVHIDRKGEAIVGTTTTRAQGYGFDGSSWTLGDVDNAQFPFAGNSPGSQWDPTLNGAYTDYLTLQGGSPMLYARTAESGGHFLLSSMGSTLVNNSVASQARHTATLAAVLGSGGLVAFATP